MKVDASTVSGLTNTASTAGGQKVGEGKAKGGEDQAPGAAELSSSATVNFSEQAQKINQVKELATPDLDEIREDKVAHFQKMIDEGSYSVDAAGLADRLVDEHLII